MTGEGMTKESGTEWDPYAGGCPSRDVLHRIGDKWTVLVLGELAESGAKRYTALRRKLEGVSEKMLTQTLRALELGRSGPPDHPPGDPTPRRVRDHRTGRHSARAAGGVEELVDQSYE